MNTDQKRVRLQWTDASGQTYYAYAPIVQKRPKTANNCEAYRGETHQEERNIELEDLI